MFSTLQIWNILSWNEAEKYNMFAFWPPFVIIGFLSHVNLGRVFITIGEGGREEGLNTFSLERILLMSEGRDCTYSRMDLLMICLTVPFIRRGPILVFKFTLKSISHIYLLSYSVLGIQLILAWSEIEELQRNLRIIKHKTYLSFADGFATPTGHYRLVYWYPCCKERIVSTAAVHEGPYINYPGRWVVE